MGVTAHIGLQVQEWCFGPEAPSLGFSPNTKFHSPWVSNFYERVDECIRREPVIWIPNPRTLPKRAASARHRDVQWADNNNKQVLNVLTSLIDIPHHRECSSEPKGSGWNK